MSASPTSRQPGRAKGPDAFRTIGEAAAEIGVEPHVLRFWETKFPHLKPLTRAGGRRYYRPSDIELLHRIRQLLYVDGLTIRGAQKILRGKAPSTLLDSANETAVSASPPPVAGESAAEASPGAPEPGQMPASRPIADGQLLRRLAAEARSIANGGPIPPIFPTD